MAETDADTVTEIPEQDEQDRQDEEERLRQIKAAPAQGTPIGNSPSNNKAITQIGQYQTKLAPKEEQTFKQWVKQNNIPWQDDPKADYDMRGYWKAQQSGDPQAQRASNLHFPDTWKTPYHKTFSNESIYATKDAPHWEGMKLIDPTGKLVADESSNADTATPSMAIKAGAPQSLGISMQQPAIQAQPQQPQRLPHAIDTGHIDPRRPGIAQLWAKADNIHNPGLRVAGKIGAGLLRGIDTIGNVVAPRLMAGIPGTTQNAALNERATEAQQGQEARTGLEKAQTEETEARTEELKNPKPEKGVIQETDQGMMMIDPRTGEAKPLTFQGKPLQKPNQEHPGIHVTDQGLFSIDPKTNQASPITYQGKPLMPPQAQKPDTPEQQFLDEYLKNHKGASIASAIGAYTATTQKPEREQRQLAVGPDGTVIELRPGMKVPVGTKPATQYGKATADEERRADLSKNLNENLDQLEDIAKRRPDLFGPFAGRVTGARGAIGTDDADIAALYNIKDNIGMVKQSSHGMRSAHHVEEAAASVLNNFHNTADAMQGAIDSARKSAATFTEDVERKEGGTAKDLGPAPAGAHEGKTGTLKDGTKIIVKGGRMVPR